MRSPGINGEGELRGQLANPGSPGKVAIKTVCMCVCVSVCDVLDGNYLLLLLFHLVLSVLIIQSTHTG